MKRTHTLPFLLSAILITAANPVSAYHISGSESLDWPEFPTAVETESDSTLSGNDSVDIYSLDTTPLNDEDLDRLFGDLPRYLDLGSFTLNKLNNVPIPQITSDGMILRDRLGRAYRVRMTWDALQNEITTRLSQYQGDWSVYLKDLSNEKTMEINEHAMESASLIKLFIAGTTYELIEKGELTEDNYLTIHEGSPALHYGQQCFEGLKAYRRKDGKINLFRPDQNSRRLNQSARRLLMPMVPEKMFIEAVKDVVKANEAFVPPYGTGATLYLRPFLIGVGENIGVHPAPEYLFVVFCTPVGAYFKGGLKPTNFIVSEYDR